jgi:hypothetical protein
MALLVRPFDRGQLSVVATPTFLSAGQLPGNTQSQQLFGTGALGNTPCLPASTPKVSVCQSATRSTG